MRTARLLAAAGLTVAVLTACGDDAGRFDDDVAAVRTAIDAGDRAAAEQALDDLADEVATSDLSATDRQEIDELIASSRVLLDEVLPTTTTTTTTSTTTTTVPPTPVPPKDDKDDDKDDKGPDGKGRGNDEGRGGGDEDDDDD